MDLEDLLDSHIDKNFHSLATQRTYQTAISIFSRDTGITDISAITVQIVEQWKEQVLARASGSTWNNYHRHLRVLFSSVVCKETLSRENPFKVVRPIHKPTEQNKVCSVEEISSSIKFIKLSESSFNPSWFWVDIIKMFYYTGMRRRQLVGLSWCDINYSNKTLCLSSAYSKTKKQWEIPITTEIHCILRTVLDETKKVLGKPPITTSQIFNITLFNERFSGSQMTGEQVTGMFRKFRRVGYSISPHKLRHTMATEICNSEDTGEGSVR